MKATTRSAKGFEHVSASDVEPHEVERAAEMIGHVLLVLAPASWRARLRDLGHLGRFGWTDARACWPAVAVARLVDAPVEQQRALLERWDAHMRLRQRLRRCTRRRRLGSVSVVLTRYRALGQPVCVVPTAEKDGAPTPAWLAGDAAA